MSKSSKLHFDLESEDATRRLTVYGPPNCGKTEVMSEAARAQLLEYVMKDLEATDRLREMVAPVPPRPTIIQAFVSYIVANWHRFRN